MNNSAMYYTTIPVIYIAIGLIYAMACTILILNPLLSYIIHKKPNCIAGTHPVLTLLTWQIQLIILYPLYIYTFRSKESRSDFSKKLCAYYLK